MMELQLARPSATKALWEQFSIKRCERVGLLYLMQMLWLVDGRGPLGEELLGVALEVVVKEEEALGGAVVGDGLG